MSFLLQDKRRSGLDTMMEPVAIWCATAIEFLGIGVISFVSLYAPLFSLYRLWHGLKKYDVFQELRQILGRGILLGLEFLIAADIIYTVAVELTFDTIGSLAIVVLIRTFLSFTLEVELTGRWPWENKEENTRKSSGDGAED